MSEPKPYGTTLSWKRPRQAFDWYWHTEGQRSLRKVTEYWIKWSVRLVPPALGSVWLLVPEEGLISTGAAVGFLAMLGIVTWIFGLLEPYVKRRWPDEFVIDEKGFRTAGGPGMSWSKIESASIEPHPELVGVRRLVLATRGRRRPKVLEFDASEVDETALATLVSQRMHADLLLRPAAEVTDPDLLRPVSHPATTDVQQLLRVSDHAPDE